MADLPATAFHRVPVHLTVTERDSNAKLIRYDAAFLAEQVAKRARALLGAGAGTLPDGEPRITYATRLVPLEVTVHRHGGLTWRAKPVPDSGGSADTVWVREGLVHRHLYDSAASPATDLLDSALRAEVAADAPFFVWPADVREDSIRFLLTMSYPGVTREGTLHASLRKGQPAFMIFSLDVPWETAVRETRAGTPLRYPERSLRGGVAGTVVMQFVVDTLGRAEPESLRDIWESKRPRPVASRAAHYRAFIDAASQHIRTARFEPASVGGCRVRQLVVKAFTYDIQ